MRRGRPLPELIGLLQRALTDLPAEALARAATDTVAAHRLLAESLTGTNDSIPLEALDASIRGQHHLEAAMIYLELTGSELHAYLADIAGTGTTIPMAGNNRFSEPMPPWDDSEAYQKTHGRWVDKASGDVHVLRSGEHDAAFHKVNEKACRLGITKPGQTFAPGADVELKFAVEMKRGQHATIVINNPDGPCNDPYGCDRLLPVFLPTGSTLTVCWPGGRKTYTGEDV